tara:strand:+ start:238 stop:1380 length:1143 start_codon:yes stop_codon:yes gene_type:complete
MSELRVDTINEATSGTGTTINKLTNPNQPFRNLLINGDMKIAQRTTSTSGVSTTGNFILDRWKCNIDFLGAFTISQSTDVPTGQGFSNSMKWDCTTADASPAAGDNLTFQQRLEGQNLQMLKKGTSNAEKTTLSFWVKSNKTGTYVVELRDKDNSNRLISKTYTISSSDTWEKKTITFDGDTTGTLTNDSSSSLDLNFWLGSGSTFSSGSLNSTWGASTNSRAVGQVNLADSTSNEWYITGVQLEVGEIATDFEHLPFDVQLQRCQRYFEKSYDLSVVPGTSAAYDGTILAAVIADGTTTRIVGNDMRFAVRKRTEPSVTIYATDDGTSGQINNYSSGANKAISSIGNISETSIGRYFTMGDAGATNEQYEFQFKADAEL